MLLDVSDLSAQRHRGLRADVPVPHSYFSTQGLDESVEAAKKRRLARSAFADESNSATGRNIDADVIERDHGAEAM